MGLYRRATAADVDRLMQIRGAVLENRLSDPLSVTRKDYDWFVHARRVWVQEGPLGIAGFSASDPRDGTIWALFVDLAHCGRGIGTALLDLACADLKADGHAVARLTTDPGTRAAALYSKLGWADLGLGEDGEQLFERVF